MEGSRRNSGMECEWGRGDGGEEPKICRAEVLQTTELPTSGFPPELLMETTI